MRKEGVEQELSRWKTIAIVFIVLFIVETFVFIGVMAFGGWVVKLALDLEEKDQQCAGNVCDLQVHDAYFYDDTSGVCYCYQDGKIAAQEYIG